MALLSLTLVHQLLHLNQATLSERDHLEVKYDKEKSSENIWAGSYQVHIILVIKCPHPQGLSIVRRHL